MNTAPTPQETLRSAAAIWVPGVVAVLGAFAAGRVASTPEVVQVMDNIHWTIAFVAGAWLAWRGVRRAAPEDLAARRWFALGMSAYAVGQLVLDVQVAVDWFPSPGPSNLFYSCLGPACLLGLWASVRAHTTPEQRRPLRLDAAALAVAVLVLTLTLYLPKQGETTPLVLAVLVGYPVTLLGALCVGVVLVISLRLPPDRTWAVFIGSLLAQGVVWMHWNSLALDDALQDGTWFNLAFSAAALALGLGAMWWSPRRSADARWDRICEGLLRVLPLMLVVLAGAAIVVVQQLPPLPRPVGLVFGLGVAVVVVLAVARQSMLLSERDRMLAAEQRARASEQRFRTLFESSHDAIFILTDQGLLDCNPRALEMFGARRDQVVGRNPLDFSAPRQAGGQPPAELVRRHFAAALAGQTPSFEWRSRRQDGTEFDSEVTLNRIAVEDRFLMQAIIRDITARKRVDLELRARTAFFEAQVDSAPDGILVVDSSGRKILQNRRMAEVWKIPPEVAVDPDDARLVRFIAERTRHPRQFAAKIAHLYAHPEEISRDLVELVDGTMLDRYSAPVRDEHGHHYGRIWTFRDVTEQRHLEEQLRQSQKMEALGQLSGGIAHDFNNLLTAIIGHLSLLRDNREVAPSVAESLEEISAAADRAAGLTRQLLAFSRRQVITFSVLNLNEVVTNLTKLLRRVLGEHVSMQVDFAPEELRFEGDAGMMEQVLVNLAVNARDAMPGGGVLRIATRGERCVAPATDGRGPGEPAEFVRLSVSDTGTGIPAEIREKVFEPFFTTKDVAKGTGLGLATVFGIVQQHHGWIELESEVGRGTTFHLHLPRVAAPAAAPPAAPKAAPSRGRGEVILLVEDEQPVREVCARALARHGYEVVQAAHGRGALAIWAERQRDIDLLLTDIVMPGGISGLQLARQLQGDKPSLKVIHTSGYSAVAASVDQPLVEGVNYLAKPYELGALLLTIRHRLDEARS